MSLSSLRNDNSIHVSKPPIPSICIHVPSLVKLVVRLNRPELHAQPIVNPLRPAIHRFLRFSRARRASAPALAFIVLTLAAIACSSAPDAVFTVSSEGGPVPHEVSFTPAETGGGVAFLWDFGDGATSDERSPTHIYQDAGLLTARLTVTNGGSQGTSEHQVTLEPGEAGWIIVEPTALELESGDRRPVSVSAFDALGNPVQDAEFNWTADSSAGSVLEDGTFVAGPEIGNYADGLKVEFERLGATASVVVPIEIVYGALDSISVEPSSINLRVNNRLDLKVVARDQQGHVLPEPDIEWDPVRGSVDTVLAGGEFKAGLLPTPGEQDLVNVSVSVDGETMRQTLAGAITPGILDRVEVTITKIGASAPAVGDPISLTTEAFDRFGNLVELESVEWQLVDDTYGEVTPEGIYTPSGIAVAASGPLVTAIGELDRVKSFADVSFDILPGIAASIQLVPLIDSVTVGSGNPYLARVVDESGNVIDDVAVTWSANSGGSITESGVFITGFETGEFPGAVTATVAPGAAGNQNELTASADILIRDRSSDTIAVEVSNTTDAWILLIDLKNATRLPLSDELDSDTGIEISPAWWPDGSRLVYSSDVTGLLQVYDIEIETGEIRQLVDDPDGSGMATISPDGKRIAYIVTKEINWQLYVADIPELDENGDIVPITRDQATKLSVGDDTQNLLPWWSPDGEFILFTASRSITENEINIVASDGSSPPRIVTNTGLLAAGWSNDGEVLLAIDNQSVDGQNLLVVDPESGEDLGFIPMPFQALFASWSPDSTEVAVTDLSTGAMWLLDSDGTSIRQTLGNNFNPRRSSWRPVPIDAAAVLAERAESQQ